MRGRNILAITAVLAALAGPVAAEEAMPAAELDTQRGGTETGTDIDNSLIQSNDSALTATNTGGVGVSYGGQKTNGQISAATVTGNHGITSLMQNTGDLVNFNNATSVNVYLR
jgi:hypothetical protein